jgi:hypothetical protein
MNNFLLGALTAVLAAVTFMWELPATHGELAICVACWFVVGITIGLKVQCWSIDSGHNGVYQRVGGKDG